MTLTLLPSLIAVPATADNELPSRKHILNDKLLPTATVPRTDTPLPDLLCPRTDSPDPNLTIEAMLVELPNATESSTETPPVPTRIRPATEALLANLKKPCKDRELPSRV